MGPNGEVLPNTDYKPKDIGWDASYMKITETYDLKDEIIRENTIYKEMCDRDVQEAVSSKKSINIRKVGSGTRTLPSTYVENIWSATGGHMKIEPYGKTEFGMDEMYTYSSEDNTCGNVGGIVKIFFTGFATNNDFKIGFTDSKKETFRTRYSSLENSSLDVNFDGINTWQKVSMILPLLKRTIFVLVLIVSSTTLMALPMIDLDKLNSFDRTHFTYNPKVII